MAVCTGLLSCSDTRDLSLRLDAELRAALVERFAPVTRPTGVSASRPCPDRRLADDRPDPTCRDARLGTGWRELSAAIRHLDDAGDDPALLRVYGLWALANGAYDRAVDELAAAVDRDPSAARHNDLAAALLLRAARGERAGDLADALEHAARASALDPGLTEAHINRAFALSSLGLRHAADRAWAEAETGAASRLAAAYRALVAGHGPPAARPKRARGEALLGRWAASCLRGDTAGADAALETASSLAAGVAARGDSTLLEAVTAVGGADPARRGLLASGHAAFGRIRGDATYATCDLETLAAAEGDLEAARTPFVAWVGIDRAICSYFEGDFPAAVRRLTDVLNRWGTPARAAIVARVHALLGLVAMVQARYADADAHYGEAIARYSALGETGETLYLHALRARNLAFGGLGQKAWALRLSALHGLHLLYDRERAATIVQDAVEALRREGRSWAALAAIDEQIHVAEGAAAQPGGEEDLVAYARIARSTLLATLDRPEEAAAELDRAEAAWRRLPAGQEIRDRIAIELGVARASRAGGDPSAIDRALAFHAERAGAGVGNRVVVVSLLRQRARAAWRRGDLAAAEEGFAAGLAEVERQRSEITDPEQGARFAAHARDLVADLVRLLLDERGDPLAALAALDRGEGRLVERGPEETARGPLAATRLAAAVPKGGLVLRWGQLPDRLLVWTIDPEGRVVLEQRRVASETVARRVNAFRRGIRSEASAEERRRLGRELARLLLPAQLAALPRDASLVLVPATSLQGLPFAALPLEGGDYLIERHVLAFAASLESLLRPTARGRSGAAPAELLLVADPAFDASRFRLGRLKDAARAVEDWGGPGTTALAGEAATRRAVLAALPRHRVLHAAAHGITDNAFPHRGGILLAMDPAEPGADLLTAGDLEGRDLGHLELVILAACSTALGTVPETAEYAGLAAAFLARGVPAVVTAAWDVEDAATVRFFATVHRRLAAGEPVAEALRAAQLESLGAADPSLAAPRTWAAFRVDRAGQARELGKKPAASVLSGSG